MKHIVITGSTRGIGFGLADAFLELGCSVTISGRIQASVEQVVEGFSDQFAPENIQGVACDVRDASQVQALWDAAQERFGKVDIWVNNAGLSGPQMSSWEIPAEQAAQVIETNLLGAIYGSQVAMRGMLAQGFGAIYNMEGMGSDGRKHNGMALYGTSKYGLKYLTDCLALEIKGTPLIVGALRPGMVVTDLVVGQFEGREEEFERFKRVMNIIADTVENVAPWLAARMLQNVKSGVRLRYLSTGKLLVRLLSGPFKKRDLFSG